MNVNPGKMDNLMTAISTIVQKLIKFKLLGASVLTVFILLATVIVMTAPESEPQVRSEKAWPVSVKSVEPHDIAPTLLAQDLRQGRGTIGKLLKSEEAYDDFRSVVRDLRRSAANIEAITLQVREGRGSLGRLIMDDTVVTDLEVMLSGFREAGEVARENAPLASLVTFTTFIFNVLN